MGAYIYPHLYESLNVSPSSARMNIDLGRSNIAVSDEVAAELSREAEKEDKTVFALTNECLSAAIQICAEGGSP